MTWTQEIDSRGTIVLTATAPRDEAAEHARQALLRSALGRVREAAARALSDEATSDVLEARLTSLVDEVLDVLDPGGA
jgi:hypothetical protein